jgi:hypothetical protein
MKTNFNRRKSLQELERDGWGQPDYDSHLVQTCHRLRRVPLADFTTEDLRIMIGQKIGLLSKSSKKTHSPKVTSTPVIC